MSKHGRGYPRIRNKSYAFDVRFDVRARVQRGGAGTKDSPLEAQKAVLAITVAVAVSLAVSVAVEAVPHVDQLLQGAGPGGAIGGCGGGCGGGGGGESGRRQKGEEGQPEGEGRPAHWEPVLLRLRWGKGGQFRDALWAIGCKEFCAPLPSWRVRRGWRSSKGPMQRHGPAGIFVKSVGAQFSGVHYATLVLYVVQHAMGYYDGGNPDRACGQFKTRNNRV